MRMRFCLKFSLSSLLVIVLNTDNQKPGNPGKFGKPGKFGNLGNFGNFGKVIGGSSSPSWSSSSSPWGGLWPPPAQTNFGFCLDGTARIETSTPRESVCASLPRVPPEQEIPAVAKFTESSPDRRARVGKECRSR